jgi:ribosomal protein L9
MEKLTDAQLREEWLAFKAEIAEHMQLYGSTSAFNAAHIQKLKAEMERRGLCLE